MDPIIHYTDINGSNTLAIVLVGANGIHESHTRSR